MAISSIYKIMENMPQEGGEKMVCKCSHHKLIPGLVVLFGLLFLLHALGVVTEGLVSVVWPVLVILAGLQKLMEGKCKCC